MKLIAIVEGHGEVQAVPVLLRRVAADLGFASIRVSNPIRVKRTRVVQPDELERHIELASRQCEASDGILVLLDADRECPAHLGPSLLARATAARPDRRIRVVLAKSEFESWFLAGARSLAGRRDLDDDLAPPDRPEEIRDAKAWLSERCDRQGGYRPVPDQPALAQLFDMSEARRLAPSFDKFWRDIEWLLGPPRAVGAP